MIDDQLTPEEQAVVDQLQAVTKLKLKPSARDTIRQQMLREFQTQTATSARQPTRRRVSWQFATGFAAALVIFMLVALAIIRRNPDDSNSIAGLATETAALLTPGAIVTTATSSAAPATTSAATATETALPTTFTSNVTQTALPDWSPTTSAAPIVTSPPLVPTLSPETLVVVEGPITNISDNVITIYGFDIEVEPEHPILKLIETGEVVRVQGTLRNDGDLVATVISNNLDTSDTDSTLATVKLEGPVEAVSGSSITVNGILVQLNADDALLQTIQVGNFVSVEGNFQSENAVIVLTVVNIAVIGTTAPEAESACWYHDNAMGMGHWHCDGMGMGDAMGPDMGMGMGPDMGMGPAMGMEN